MEWRPNPGPQERFHASWAYEVFYGGAAGGGKTESLIMEALRYVHVPGYNAVLFRRTFPELRQANGLVERSRVVCPIYGGRYNEQTFTWRFPSGATLRFSQLEHENDKYDHQSAEYHFVGFDELTTFEESQYLYLMSRIRSAPIDPNTGKPIPLRIRSASNPGNIGHEWVKARFVLCQPEFQIGFFRREGDIDVPCEPTHEDALSRQYIPAKLKDNPKLLERDPTYKARLRQLPLIERERLLNGDWDILLAGNVFHTEWFKRIPAAPEGLRWVRYWDLAASVKTAADYTASVAVATDDAANLYFRDMVRIKREWPDARTIIKATMLSEPWVVEHGIEKKMHGLAATQELTRDPDLINVRIKEQEVTNDKLSRALAWSHRAESGKVYLVDGPWVSAFLAECAAFDGEGKSHDDQVDTASGGVGMLAPKKWITRYEFLHL